MNCGRNLKCRLDLLVEGPSVTDVPVEGTQGGSLGDNAVTVVRARGATALNNDMRLQTSSYQLLSFTGFS